MQLAKTYYTEKEESAD